MAFTLLPAIPAFHVARGYGRIRVLPLRSIGAERPLASGVPALLDPRSLAVREDGALAVADWGREGVLVTTAGATRAKWLPVRGRFEVQFGQDGGIALLDVSDGTMVLLSPDGRPRDRFRVRLSSAPAFCVTPDGGFLVSDGKKLVRVRTDVHPPAFADVLAVEGIRAVAHAPGRLYLSTSSGWLLTYSVSGEPLNRTRLVGNPGPLAILSEGGVLMADERTARLWEFDRDGRLLGRLDTGGQTAAALGVAHGTTIVVAGDQRVSFLEREAR